MDLTARRIAAVVSKKIDYSAGSTFVFVIKNNDTFCVPNCPDKKNSHITAKTPMMFYDNAAKALENGLQPCSTCNPDLTAIDVGKSVINSTVNAVNATLGYTPSHQSAEMTPTPDLDSLDSFTPDLHTQNMLHASDDRLNDDRSRLLTVTSHDLQGSPSFVTATNYDTFTTQPADLNVADPFLTLADVGVPPLPTAMSSLGEAMNTHHRSASNYGQNVSSSMEAQRWKPRRASIANGHIQAASAALDKMVMSAQNASATETSSESSSPNDTYPPDSSTVTPRTIMENSSSPATKAASKFMFGSPASREESSKHRGDGDHARLVNEACRSIAAAAAAAAASAASAAAAAAAADGADSAAKDSPYTLHDGRIVMGTKSNSMKGAASRKDYRKPLKLQRKKRRGGILGFKELAAKAGLSPWHFHRVFRSVTGLTPKAYGEACWDAVIADPALPVAIANGTTSSSAVANKATSQTNKDQNNHYGMLNGNQRMGNTGAHTFDASLTDAFSLGGRSSVTDGGMTASGKASPIIGGFFNPGVANSATSAAAAAATGIVETTSTWKPNPISALDLDGGMYDVVTSDGASTSMSGFSYGMMDNVGRKQDMTETDELLADIRVTTPAPSSNGWSMLAGNPFNMQPVSTPVPHQFANGNEAPSVFDTL